MNNKQKTATRNLLQLSKARRKYNQEVEQLSVQDDNTMETNRRKKAETKYSHKYKNTSHKTVAVRKILERKDSFTFDPHHYCVHVRRRGDGKNENHRLTSKHVTGNVAGNRSGDSGRLMQKSGRKEGGIKGRDRGADQEQELQRTSQKVM